jgi:hypothetical protein
MNKILFEFIKNRPLLMELLEEFVKENSPMIQNYVKKISEITGLPYEVVKNSQPVKNYIRKILGSQAP